MPETAYFLSDKLKMENYVFFQNEKLINGQKNINWFFVNEIKLKFTLTRKY